MLKIFNQTKFTRNISICPVALNEKPTRNKRSRKSLASSLKENSLEPKKEETTKIPKKQGKPKKEISAEKVVSNKPFRIAPDEGLLTSAEEPTFIKPENMFDNIPRLEHGLERVLFK